MLDEDTVRWGRLRARRAMHDGSLHAPHQAAPADGYTRTHMLIRCPRLSARSDVWHAAAARFDAFLKENDEKVQEAIRRAEAEAKVRRGLEGGMGWKQLVGARACV